MTRLLWLLVCHATAVVLRRTPLTPLTVTGRDAGAFLHAIRRVDSVASFFSVCRHYLDHAEPMPLSPFEGVGVR